MRVAADHYQLAQYLPGCKTDQHSTFIDSIKNYKTILSVPDPMNKENAMLLQSKP
jgi:hypothetical protein